LVYLRARYYAPNTGRFLTKDVWTGDINKPETLNRWLYGSSNPVLYADPTGRCPQPKNDSDTCWQLLLQIENQYGFIDLQSELTTDNYWTSDDLLKVQSELERYSRASKIGLSTLYPDGVKIRRIRKTKTLSGGVFVCGETPRYFTSGRPITLYDTWVQGCLIHELAHYLDWANLHASKPFEKYLGANTFLIWYNVGTESAPIYIGGNPTNRSEDFAESLSEYVLLYTNYSGPDIGIIPGQKRWNFIESVLDTGQFPSNKESTTSCIPSYFAFGSFDSYRGIDE
jgi:hypothetical protein